MQIQANKMEITRSWKEPVYEQKRLGSIPSDQYESVFMPGPYYGNEFSQTSTVSLSGETPEAGHQDVWRNVPVYDANGQPKMTEVTRTLSETPYDTQKSTMVSAGVGGALGAAAAAGLSAILGGGAGSVVISGLLGGAAGGGAGYFIGQKSTQGDTIVEKTVTESIDHPRLTGYEHVIDPDVHYQSHTHYDNDHHHHGHNHGTHTDTVKILRGYQHRYNPIIHNTSVGSYSYPTLEHTARVGPGLGGVLAGAAGLGLGAAIAGIVQAVI